MFSFFSTGNIKKTSLQVKNVKGYFFILSKNVKLNIVFKSSKRINNAFHFKDILLRHINSKVLNLCTTLATVFRSVRLNETY